MKWNRKFLLNKERKTKQSDISKWPISKKSHRSFCLKLNRGYCGKTKPQQFILVILNRLNYWMKPMVIVQLVSRRRSQLLYPNNVYFCRFWKMKILLFSYLKKPQCIVALHRWEQFLRGPKHHSNLKYLKTTSMTIYEKIPEMVVNLEMSYNSPVAK